MFHHASPLYRHKDLSDQYPVLETSSAPIRSKTFGPPVNLRKTKTKYKFISKIELSCN